MASVAAGLIIGAVEVVLAVAFAAFVFGGLLMGHLPDGIGLYLVAAALTLGVLAWRAGSRGVVGSVQDAATAVLAVVATAAAVRAAALTQVAEATAVGDFEIPDPFLTVIAATLVVTVLCGVVVLGARDVPARQPDPVRARIRSSAASSLAPGGCSSRAASTSPRASCRTCARSGT